MDEGAKAMWIMRTSCAHRPVRVVRLGEGRDVLPRDEPGDGVHPQEDRHRRMAAGTAAGWSIPGDFATVNAAGTIEVEEALRALAVDRLGSP